MSNNEDKADYNRVMVVINDLIAKFEFALEDLDNEAAHGYEDELLKMTVTAMRLNVDNGEEIASLVMKVINGADYERWYA